jgi:CheY-like chemotaxis protein
VTLVTRLAPDTGRVRADPVHLEQVIINLAVNARDAMPGGGKLTIETLNVYMDADEARQHFVPMQPGRYVLIAVSDTGAGMDECTRHRIFEPFFTTKGKGRGTGLGLATVYGTIKQSGGNIWVYSEPGLGTTFKVYLPRVDVPADAVRLASAAALDGSETVLLVEDNEMVRKIAAQALSRHGYRLLLASNADEAEHIARSYPDVIHVLLTDVVLGVRSGRQLADAVAPLRPATRVIYMSGYAHEAIVQHDVLEAGMAFLQKPFTATAIASKVREVLDRT